MAWAPDYVSVAELAAYLRISDAVDDTELALAITAASRAVDRHCNRQFGVVAAAEERFYTARPDHHLGRWVIDIDDLMSTTGLVVENSDGDVVTDYRLEPRNAAAMGRPWTRLTVAGDATVQPDGTEHGTSIVAPWGWSAVPSAVKLGTRLQSSRFHSRRDSPHGIAGSPELGSELRLLERLDADVAVALRDYRRPRRPQ